MAIRNILLTFGSTFVCLIILELILRLFPVIDVFRNQPLNIDSPPLSVSSKPHEILSYSKQWNFLNARVRKINNYGFLSDYDYIQGHSGPVVIGDSYVEAFQVDFKEVFHQRVAAKLGFDVYNFGTSGSPLSQYEAYLSQICTEFQPKKVIIPIISNDFDESFYGHRQRDGFFHYRDDGSLQATPYQLSLTRKMANQSSLVKYFYFHLDVGRYIRGQINSLPQEQQSADQNPLQIKVKATQRFLTALKQYCVKPEDILFILDADRNDISGIYGPSPVRSEVYSDFNDKANQLGYKVIDMQPIMQDHYLKNSRFFEKPYDGHWNLLGHQIVANAIINHDFF